MLLSRESEEPDVWEYVLSPIVGGECYCPNNILHLKKEDSREAAGGSTQHPGLSPKFLPSILGSNGERDEF